MNSFIYFWCGLTLVVAAVLFFPLFIFLAAVYGAVALAVMLF